MSKLRNLPASQKALLKRCFIFIMVVALLAVAMGLSVAHGADNQSQKTTEQNSQALVSKQDDASAKELYAQVKKPTTPIELLKNIKFALDHELLLRDDFYTDENLMRFLGGSKVKWLNNRPGLRQASVRNLGNLFEKSSEYPRMGIDAVLRTADKNNRYAESGKRLQGVIKGHTAGDSRLTIETVKSIFGEPTEVFNPYAGENPRHPSLGGPKIHPLGHMAFRYKFDYPPLKATAVFKFDGEGTLDRFSAGLEEVR